MIDNAQFSKDDLMDVLMDLKHDLGKYIRLPLAMLSEDAADDEVREAVRTALMETRRGPSGVRPAKSIWMDFQAEVLDALDGYSEWPRLSTAVEKALLWQDALDMPEKELDKRIIVSDFGTVSECIQKLVEEVSFGKE